MPSPDFQLTPSGLEGMDGGMTEEKEREIERVARERGLSMTPTQGLGFDRFGVPSFCGSLGVH